jgi:dTDP-4-amino-4,6-dideoxy-D-galactose acyltransferase
VPDEPSVPGRQGVTVSTGNATMQAAVRSLLDQWSARPYRCCIQESAADYVWAHLQQDGDWVKIQWDAEVPTELLHLQPLAWDSEVLQRRVARIATWVRAEENASTLLSEAIQEARVRGVQYLWTRVPGGDFVAIRQLVAEGFEPIDGLITFSAAVRQPNAEADHISCRFYRSGDCALLEEIAARSFRLGRFFEDPALPAEFGRAAYRRWVRDSCGGYSDAVLVADADGPVGFTTVKIDKIAAATLGTKIAVIGLVATSTEHQRRGIGKSLVAATLRWCTSAGCAWVQVGTQIGNVAAARLYESAGFRMTDSSITLRKLL